MRSAACLVVMVLFTGYGSVSYSAAPASPVQFLCSGAKVDAARKIARDNKLVLGMDPGACFVEMKLTPSDRLQIVVATPSPKCASGKLLNVYDQSRAGSYYALFESPVCGTSISVGPRSPYGDNLITIDGRQYLDKAGSFVLFK